METENISMNNNEAPGVVNYWDPATQTLSSNDLAQIQSDAANLSQKFEKYRNNPGLIKRNQILLALLGFGLFFLWELFSQIPFLLQSGSFNPKVIYENITVVLFAIVPISVYRYYIKELQKDLINMLVATKFGWMYDPTKQTTKWSILKGIFPEIFDMKRKRVILQAHMKTLSSAFNFHMLPL
jgi:hypothetical protein